MENLFNSMDDAGTTFQRKVYETLLNAIAVISEVVVKRNAIVSLSLHHSSEFCKMLLNQSP